jgi:hemerythrin
MSPMMERCESSVGIRLLNVDHREMEALIDQLQGAITAGSDKDRTIRLLRKLSDFTRTHFALEEGMMSANEYPDMAAHRGCHQQLLLQLDGFISLYLKGRLTLSQESLSFLFVWHAAHSQNNDAHYADWLVMRDAGFCQNQPQALPRAGRESCA